MNSLSPHIYVFPQEWYLPYPAKLCSILPWMWMALMSRFVSSKSIELSLQLFFFLLVNIIYFPWFFILKHMFLCCITSCYNINIQHIHICSDCLCLGNRLKLYYYHRFPMKRLLHLNKLWTVCHFMSIQTTNVTSI